MSSPISTCTSLCTLAEAQQYPVSEVGQLTHDLQQHKGLFIPALFEEQYYLSVNLPEQLGRLFRPIRPERIDEDLLDDLCQQAMTLVRGSALMDDSIQLLYRALKRAELQSTGLIVQRPDEPQHREVSRPSVQSDTAALQALKRLWAHDWSLEQVLERLDSSGKIGIEARPTLIYDAS